MYQSVVFSCEHAGNNVPDEYAHLFQDEPEVLKTHRGWDPGAWTLAQFFSSSLNAPLQGCESTRLLIEANRSEGSPELFSMFSKKLLPEQKEKLYKEIYKPYRNQLQSTIEASKKPVLHLSIHSFTPIWNGEERMVDIGILFDPNKNQKPIIVINLKSNWKNICLILKSDLTNLIEVPMMALLLGYESYIPTRFIPELNWKSIKSSLPI
ncbi:MAG: N-formylglutamate amidohydrolase [Flammeovirgaceae bacterium]|nr:N-formylglutamate amidohydrolase [Flammeovirgaceae bacterium]